MRKVVAGLFISLDGVTEAPDKWQFEFDADMGVRECLKSQFGASLRSISLIIAT